MRSRYRYDHTMVISKLHNKLYVLGGKFVNPADTAPAESTGTTPSGLFEYDLLSKRWTAILYVFLPRLRCIPLMIRQFLAVS